MAQASTTRARVSGSRPLETMPTMMNEMSEALWVIAPRTKPQTEASSGWLVKRERTDRKRRLAICRRWVFNPSRPVKKKPSPARKSAAENPRPVTAGDRPGREPRPRLRELAGAGWLCACERGLGQPIRRLEARGPILDDSPTVDQGRKSTVTRSSQLECGDSQLGARGPSGRDQRSPLNRPKSESNETSTAPWLIANAAR